MSGMALAVIGIALMCGMDAVAKALGAHLDTFSIVFLRFFGAALWLAVWIAVTRGQWPKRSELGRHAQRAILLVATASMFFHAVGNLPLAVVAALAMTAPVYVTLLGAVVFKEKLGAGIWAALLLGALGSSIIVFSGGGIVLTPGMGTPLAWTAAMLAPLTYAVMLVLLKKHSATEDPAAMTLGQSLLASLFVLPLALGPWPAPSVETVGLGGLIGLLGAVGFLTLTHGLRKIAVSAFAVIDYSALVWAGVFGSLFFGEVPGVTLIFGGALIVVACLLNARAAHAGKAA
jgi:drug/metabolite transporter (DMT)-like permease